MDTYNIIITHTKWCIKLYRKFRCLIGLHTNVPFIEMQKENNGMIRKVRKFSGCLYCYKECKEWELLKN